MSIIKYIQASLTRNLS